MRVVMSRRTILWLLLVLFPLGIVAGYLHDRWTRTQMQIDITQAQIDAALAKRFPREKKYLKIIRIRYMDPQAILIQDSKRVRVGLDVVASAGIPGLEKEYRGGITLLTRIGYDGEKKQLYLHDATLERLDFPKVPERYLDLTEQIVSLAYQEFGKKIPVYTIPEKDWKQQMARYLVQSVDTEHGVLRINLKLPEATAR